MPSKEYYEKNKEHLKEYNKEWRENNKEHLKEWRENNKEHLRGYNKEYRQTPSGIKSNRINGWKISGIIVENYNELYDYYMMTWNCEYCWCPLVEGRYGFNKRCLDHDHNTGEVRGVLCNRCNIRDVYSTCGAPSESE